MCKCYWARGSGRWLSTPMKMMSRVMRVIIYIMPPMPPIPPMPECVLDNIDPLLLVLVGRSQGVQDWEATQQSNTTTGNNALLNSSPGGVQGVGDPVLLLVHLNLRGAADLENSHTTGEPGHPLLDLLLLVLPM